MSVQAEVFMMKRFGPRRHGLGFTLAEAVIASGFVGIALAGFLSLAPALIRGQHDIVQRTRAEAAATELLGMFYRHELPGQQAAEIEEAADETVDDGNGSGRRGLLDAIAGLVGELLPDHSGPDPGDPEPQPTQSIQATVRGFDGSVTVTRIDPGTLAPDAESSTAFRVTVVISQDGRELSRLDTIRTEGWVQADERRVLTP